jgi:predicted butyrate kinase (DUF1464 family)
MKFVSMDKIYELSDEVGSAYVDVCLIDNELATERVIPIEVLEEIRQEIAQIKATKLYSTIDLKDMVLAIIDKHMEERHD